MSSANHLHFRAGIVVKYMIASIDEKLLKLRRNNEAIKSTLFGDFDTIYWQKEKFLDVHNKALKFLKYH